jgi:hypothetical protein
MKQSDFKKIIKEAVREAIQEELKDILLEAVRQPKTVIKETFDPSFSTGGMYAYGEGISTSGITGTSNGITGTSNALSSRQAIMGMLDDMKMGKAKFTTNNIKYTPPPADTISEGSKLPEGEVGLDQIMGLMK